MKKIFLLIFIFILLIVTGFSEDFIKREFKVEEGKQLHINLKAGGSIEISGWDKKAVNVIVHFKNSDQADWDIQFNQVNTGIEITGNYADSRHKRNNGLEFEIRVPKKFDLNLKTMGGGISIDNINGKIGGKTMGGSLKLSHLKGKINLKTMGGKILLKNSDIDGQVKTMGGRVLLENVVGDVKGSSMGGNVVYKNVKSRKGVSTGKTVKITTMGGSISVEDAGEGADVQTMGGKIHIKSAKKFIKAKTMGGNIKIDQINGWVNATTMGGKIDVTMIGNPKKGKRDVFLTSMGGDIILVVPKGLAMDIDIELAFTKNSYKKYKIVSDFKIKIEESDEWGKSKGSHRKIIYGKGKTGNGMNKIKIRTVNGNVFLKKGK